MLTTLVLASLLTVGAPVDAEATDSAQHLITQETAAEAVVESTAAPEAVSVEAASATPTAADNDFLGTLTDGSTQLWCGGWGTIYGCTSSRQCYSSGFCGSTGGVCRDNCCLCY